MSSTTWFVRLDDQVLGPIPDADLRNRAPWGSVTDKTPVSSDGANWVEAAAVAGIVFGPALPPTPAALDQKQLSQKIQQLRHDIIQNVLGDEPSLPISPLIDSIRQQHGRLQDQIGKGQDRVQQLSAAKVQYEPLERAYAKNGRSLQARNHSWRGLPSPWAISPTMRIAPERSATSHASQIASPCRERSRHSKRSTCSLPRPVMLPFFRKPRPRRNNWWSRARSRLKS